MRPTRGGRPNKVFKPGSAPRRPSRSLVAGHFAQYQEGDAAGDERDDAVGAAVEDELPGGAPEAGDVDHDMQQQPAESIDLNAAANILANGGVAAVGGPSGLYGPDADALAASDASSMPPAPMGPAVDYPSPNGQQQGQQHPPQHHQQQHQQQQHHHAHHQQHQQHGFRATEDLARESGYTDFKIDSAFAKRLSREPGQRVAEQRKVDQHLNLVRRSNVEALFAQIAGDLAPSPCHHCRKGQGPWTQCVLYGGQMMGSCANCWFNASGSRCSFHEKSNPPPPSLYHPHVTGPMLGAEPGGAYSVPPLPMAASSASADPATPGQAQAQAQAAAAAPLGAYHIPAAFSDDPNVRYAVEKAVLEVRQASRQTRQLMKIEMQARQLALQIVEFEEAAQQQQQQHAQQQHAPSEHGL